MLYVTVFAALLLAGALTANNYPLRVTTYKLVLLLLFLFVAFRFEVGCDWMGYLAQYAAQRGVGFEGAWDRRDPLWWLAIELIHRGELPYPWLNVLSAIVFFAGVHVLARQQPDPLAFLILLFPILILNVPMSGIRQATALGFICFAFVDFKDRRLLRFILWTVVAAGFHSSASIFLLLTPLVGGSYSRGRLILSGLLAVPGALLLASGNSGELALERYVDSGTDAYGAVYRTATLFLTGLFFFSLLHRSWIRLFPRDLKLASVGALMMIAVFPLITISSVIADRLGYYFVPLQAMMFARTPFLVAGPYAKLLSIAPYLGLMIILIVWTNSSRHFNVCYVPYQTWLFGYPTGMPYF